MFPVVDRCIHPKLRKHPRRHAFARNALALILTHAAISPLSALVLLSIGVPGLALMSLVFALLGLAAIIPMRRSGWLLPAQLASVGSGYLIITYVLWHSGGNVGTAAGAWLVTIPVLGVTTGGLRLGASWLVVTLSTIAGFALARVAGFTFPVIPVLQSSWLWALVNVLLLLLFATLAMLTQWAKQTVEDRLHSLATSDSLTGLLNRRCFAERLDYSLARVSASGGSCALLLLDLDGFKQVNDRLGHLAGDEVLIETARRLVATVGAAGTAARLGGDEFAVIVDRALHEAAVLALADALIAEVAAPMRTSAGTAQVGLSIGIAFAQGSSTSRSLLAQADAALYRAKKLGRGRHAR